MGWFQITRKQVRFKEIMVTEKCGKTKSLAFSRAPFESLSINRMSKKKEYYIYIYI